ncbi:MAG: efflux RND transporter periplasmic adaptor subunit [bacterium]|nr:MAG: efflux RND transporter periplasmic adaptor subunit [bacterium]
MKRFYNLLTILIIIGFAVLQWNCGKNTHSKTKNNKDADPTIPVEVAQVTMGDISAFFSGTATIEAEEETDVVAKVGGVVKEIFVEEGDYIKEGQVLAKLDDEKLLVQVEQAKATLQKLENVYKRNEELFKKSLISADEFQRTKYEYEHQKASYDLAQLDLNYSSIRSPISGVVAERKIKVGNMVLPNQATFRVTSLDPLLAVLHVPERQMVKLRVGQQAKLGVDAVRDKEFIGKIKRISPVVDPGTGTVKVTVEMYDPSRQLKPGMFARLNIIYDVRKNTMLVPKDAIMAEDKESAVYVVKDSLALRQVVETGYVNTTHIEILSGLAPKDTVVTTGKGSLKDSSKVELVATKVAKK